MCIKQSMKFISIVTSIQSLVSEKHDPIEKLNWSIRCAKCWSKWSNFVYNNAVTIQDVHCTCILHLMLYCVGVSTCTWDFGHRCKIELKLLVCKM
jgi:hypothetical protein